MLRKIKNKRSKLIEMYILREATQMKCVCACICRHHQQEFHSQWGARRDNQRGLGSPLRCWDRKLIHRRHEPCTWGKQSRAKQSNAGSKAEMLTSNFPIGFQGRLPTHGDSARLPFSSNDCQILGSRGRGCEMKQRQGLVIGCERRQTFMGLLITMLTLRIHHAVYHADLTIYDLFQVF